MNSGPHSNKRHSVFGNLCKQADGDNATIQTPPPFDEGRRAARRGQHAVRRRGRRAPGRAAAEPAVRVRGGAGAVAVGVEGPSYPVVMRRHADDGSSPFARERFSLLSLEEQSAVIVKRRMQKVASQALDAQLLERHWRREQSQQPQLGRPSSPDAVAALAAAAVDEPASWRCAPSPPSLAQPTHHAQLDSQPQPPLPDDGAIRQRSGSPPSGSGGDEWMRAQPNGAQPVLAAAPVAPAAVAPVAAPAVEARDDDTPWWHESDARRSPPPRRRSGRELLRDPEESLVREAERVKKREVGEALRAQMQEREHLRTGHRPHRQISAEDISGPGHPNWRASEALSSATEGYETVVQPFRLPERDSGRGADSRPNQPAATAVAVAVAEASTLWLNQPPERQQQEHQSHSPEAARQIHERLALLEYQIQPRHVAPQTDSVAVVASPADFISLAHELRTEMAAIQAAHATLNSDLDEQVDFLAHLDKSVKEIQSRDGDDGGVDDDADPYPASINRSDTIQIQAQAMAALRHDVDRLLAKRSKSEADLEVRLASLVEGLRQEVSSLGHSSFDHQRVETLERCRDDDQAHVNETFSGLEEHIAAIESQLAAQADTLETCARSQEAAVASNSKMQNHADTRAVDLHAGRLEVLQREMEKRFDVLSSAPMATDINHINANAPLPPLAAVADSALVSGLSVRIDVLERGKESDLAQLSEKLNGVEEKQWDEQVALSQQIAALESQLAGQAEPASA